MYIYLLFYFVLQVLAQGELPLLIMIWSGSFRIPDDVSLLCLITILVGGRPSGTTPNGTRAIWGPMSLPSHIITSRGIRCPSPSRMDLLTGLWYKTIFFTI